MTREDKFISTNLEEAHPRIQNFANPKQAEGYKAYMAGIPLTQNPYNAKDEPFYADQWINGWAWARTDHKDANRTKQQEQP